MNDTSPSRVRSAVRWAPAVAAAGVAAIALLVMLGWLAEVELLKSLLHSSRIAMNPMTATAFLLSAVGLWQLRRDPPSRRAAITADLCGLAVMAVAGLRIADYAVGWRVGVDQWLFASRLDGNVMAPNTAATFLLLGGALVLLDVRTRWRFYPAQVLVIAGGCIAVLSLTGYLYSSAALYRFQGYIPMALNTALAFLLLATGLLCSRPRREPLAILLSDSVGGVVARRLVPAAFLAPLLIGWLQLQGERQGVFDPGFGLLVFVLANILVLNLLIWWCAGVLRATDLRRRRVESELRESEQRYHSVMEQAADGIYLVDVETKQIVDANPAMERLLGYDDGELSTRMVYDLVCDTRENVEARLAKLAASESPLRSERTYLRRDGSCVDVESSACVIDYGGRRVACTVVHDITRRKQAQDELRKARNFLDSIIENIPNMVFVKEGGDLRFVRFNRAGAELLGVRAENMVGKNDYDFFPKEEADFFTAKDRAVLESGKLIDITEEPIHTPSGVRYLHTKKIPLRGADGRVEYLLGISEDVTDRKAAEEALRTSEERFRALFDDSPSMLFLVDPRGIVMSVNAFGAAHLGYAPQDLVGGHVEVVIHPEDRPLAATFIDRSLQAHGRVEHGELRKVRRDGSVIWVRETARAVSTTEGQAAALIVCIDFSELKHAEDALHESYRQLEAAVKAEQEAHAALKRTQATLVQSEKLAGLGQLVAGVAHEINNPLSFVANNVAVLQRDIQALRELLSLYQRADAVLAERDAVLLTSIRDLCERIDLPYTLTNLEEVFTRSREGLRRIQQIVKDLRDFARLDESDLHEVDLGEGIRSTTNIIAGKARRKRVKIDLQLGELPRVACYPAKVNQVVMNLLSNAIDACDEGGCVTLTTAQDGDDVVIQVSDTGRGVPPAIRDRIFDPFFTTKPQGEGTGLGLSISYGIVRDHGGTISVGDAPGGGALFTVRLPRDATRSRPRAASAPAVSAPT